MESLPISNSAAGVLRRERRRFRLLTTRSVLALALCLGGLGLLASPSSAQTIVVLPDTQYYAESFPDIFTAQTQWIAANKVTSNIVFVLHEGDITQNNNEAEWQNAVSSMSVLDGVVPYALSPGNHDTGASGPPSADTRDTTLYNTYFPVTLYETLPTFGGVFEAGKLDNSFHFFSAAGTDWLVVALEFGPRDPVLDWANQVVAANPDRRVIVVTHAYLYSDDTLHGSDLTVLDYQVKGACLTGVYLEPLCLAYYDRVSIMVYRHPRVNYDRAIGRVPSHDFQAGYHPGPVHGRRMEPPLGAVVVVGGTPVPPAARGRWPAPPAPSGSSACA